MAIGTGEIEIRNVVGSTDHHNGTVGTTAINIPSSPGAIIQSVLIDNTNTSSKDLLVSFDGGTNYKTVAKSSVLTWTVKGCLTQIKLKGSDASTEYEILINREEV